MVTSEFDYLGPAISGTVYTALYVPTFYDPHNEIAKGTKAFSIPATPTTKRYGADVILTAPAGYSGTNFGLYSKIIAPGIGTDILSPYYDNVIEILAPAPPGFTLETRADPTIGGWVTRSPIKDYYQKYEQVTLNAWVLGLYKFSHWTNRDGTTIGTSSTIVIPMVRDEIITAHFTLAAPPPTPIISNLKIYKYTARPWRGATCYVHVSFDYKGPTVTRTLYAAIGHQYAYFDEYLKGWKTIEIQAAADWEVRLAVVAIEIPTTARLETFDLYAKIDTILTPIYYDVVTIIE